MTENNMTEILNKLTPEQESHFDAWVEKWTAIGLSTESADFEAAKEAMLDCYRVADLSKPRNIICGDGPLETIREIRKDILKYDGQDISESTIFSSYRGGNLWAGWYAHITFLREICGIEDECLADFAHDEQLALSASWTFWMSTVGGIVNRPSKILLDDQGRLHSAIGPSITWRNGEIISSWHGVTVPDEWAQKVFPTPIQMLRWKNLEQRPAGCQMMGWDRILGELKTKVIDTDDPLIGTLIEADIPGSGKERFLVVTCGTGRENIVLGVERTCKTALEANASLWGSTGVSENIIKNLGART